MLVPISFCRLIEEKLSALVAELERRVPNGGQRHEGRGCEADVVVADDRDVVGNAEPPGKGDTFGAEGEKIVRTEEGVW